MGCLEIQFCQKNEGGLFGNILINFEKKLISREKGRGKSHSAEKIKRGTLLLHNSFVFHVIYHYLW